MKNIKAMRILILVAIASQTAAFIFSIFGLNCTSIGLQRPDLKYRLVRRKSDKDIFFKCCIQNIVSLIFHLISLISISIGTILFTVALMKNSDQSDQYQVFQTSRLWPLIDFQTSPIFSMAISDWFIHL